MIDKVNCPDEAFTSRNHIWLAMSDSKPFDSIEAIEASLAVCHENAISYKGKKGYFVDMGSLLQMERSIDKLSRSSGGESEKIKLLREDIASLKEHNKALSDETHNLRTFLNDAKEDARSFQTQFEMAVQARNALQLEKKAERASLSGELESLKEAKSALEKKLASPEFKFDPASALDIQEEASELRKQIKFLNSQLETNNLEINAANAEVSGIKSKLDAAKCQRDSYKEQLDSLTNQKNNAANLFKTQVSLPKPEFSPLVKRVLGEKGAKWMHKAEESMWNDYRERVYCMMLATKSAKTANLRSISQLLEIVFHWLKKQLKKVHQKVASWVDLVENDIRKMKVKSVKFYRDELEKLKLQIDKARTEKEKYGTWEREQEKWYETIYFYGLVFKNRIKRKTNSVLHRISSFFSWISGRLSFSLRHKKWSKGKDAATSDVVFDYENEHKILMSEEEHKEEGGPPPPPLPAPKASRPKSKKVNEMRNKLAGLMGA